MEEKSELMDPEKKEESGGKQLRGLYKNVKISVKTLNMIIVVLCAALVVCMAIGISNRGFIVTFDSMGGTAVESQKLMYGELIAEPEPPTREGYVFGGWYLDENLLEAWDMDGDTVTGSINLYAKWIEG